MAIGLTSILIAAAGGAAFQLFRPKNGANSFVSHPSIRVSDLMSPNGTSVEQPKLGDTVDSLNGSSFVEPITASENHVETAGTEIVGTDSAELALTVNEKTGLEDPTTRLIVSTGSVGLALGAQFITPWLIPVSLLSTVYLAVPIFKESYQATVKEGKLKVDVLDATIISLCLVFQQIGAAAFMVWILDLADLLLDKTTQKSKDFVADIFGEQPRHAWLLSNGNEIQVDVTELKKGDHIIVGTGEQVPVDGLVIDGDAMIDQQSLTGESAPAEKRAGDDVFAMTVIVAGRVTVEVAKTGQDTLASQIIQIVSNAAEYKVDVQSKGEQIADQMVLPTLGLGAVGFFLKGSSAMLATINADYGTGIRVAAPIALLASLGNAARNGILVKDSKVFELLPEVDVVLFDKTGTLTHDVPIVSRIVPANPSVDPDQILLYTAAAEQKFSHPIASAILKKAGEKSMTLPPLDDSHYHVGFGIEVSLDGHDIKVGSSRYMDREAIVQPPSIQEALAQSRAKGTSAILIAIDGEMAGLIEMEATVRDEAKDVIAMLQSHNVSEMMLISGDHEAPTQELARQLGITKFAAGVLPHEKADYVKSYQEAGKKVMMVGDGINDSAALSLADISVSLKGASTIAVDVADVIFMDGSLKQFGYLYELSDQLNRNVQRSFMMIAIPNTLCIIGAMTGVFGLGSSLVLNNGFNFAAALNGMTPLLGQNKEEKNVSSL